MRETHRETKRVREGDTEREWRGRGGRERKRRDRVLYIAY